MKILQLIYESIGSPFGFGGAGVRAYEIYKRLKERHDITLLCMKYPGAKDCLREGLRHTFIGAESRSLTRSVLAYTIGTAGFVRKHGNDFDVIVENFLPSTPFFTKLFTKTPVVLQVQGVMERHSLRKFSPAYAVPLYIVERFYPRLYDTFIFVSDITKEKVLPKNRKRTTFCHVIPNGIDEELLRAEPGDGRYILFFSRIDIYTKGLDILVKAFEDVSKAYPEMRLVLAGYEFDSFRELVSGMNPAVREKVTHAGFVTGHEKIKLLSEATLCVLPSRHESSPISILEAAACGKPLVVSDIPELAFVQSEGFGLSFSSGSAHDLSQKLKMLLRDNETRETLGNRGREFSQKRLWDNSALLFERVLKQASSEHEKKESLH